LNAERAIFLAAVSQQTYVQFESDGEFTLPTGFRTVTALIGRAGVPVSMPELFGFVIESDTTIVVAFRGTDSSPDVTSDLDLFQTPFDFVPDGGMVHRGGLAIYTSMREQILAALRHLDCRKRLLLTGHSLGGGLATLCALDVAVNSAFRRPKIYTFASGRVGDPQFVGTFDRRVPGSARIINVHDVVQFFPQKRYPPPFTPKALVYRHVQQKFPIAFQTDNIPLNHLLANYLARLCAVFPAACDQVCSENPGLCLPPGAAAPGAMVVAGSPELAVRR
jgi:triacylglycerol lipase